MYVVNSDICFRAMESRRADPLCVLVLTVIVVIGTAMADDTPEKSGDHETTTKDGCRVRPGSHGVGVEVECSGLRLGYIPKDLPTDLRSLIMRDNNITRMSDYVLHNHSQLTSLDLSRNNLQGLGAHAFIGLSRLEKLDLTHNKLCMDNDTFPVGLFSGMTSLRRLTLTSNTCKTQHSEYPADALADLPALEYLSLTGIPVVRLGVGFSRLASLKTLVFAGQGCKMPVVRNVTFLSLMNAKLSHLCIKACHLETLEAGALKPLSRLKTLNLACNQNVNFRNVYAAIINVKNMTLNTLVVDDVTPTSLPLVKETFKHNAFTDVERLSIRANYITEVDVRMFRPLKRLTHINIGYNVIMRMLPEVNSTEALLSTLFGLNLDVVDISDTFTSMAVYRRRYCFREARPSEEDPPDPTEYFFRKPPSYADVDFSRPSRQQRIVASYHGKKDPVPIPPSVQVIYADNANVKASRGATFSVATYNDVVVLNISHNPHITRVGIVRGLRHCQVLDARNCSINTIRRGALSDMRMLKYLLLMDNNIGNNGHDLSGMFDGLSALETLDLSGNAISHIHASAFSSLSNLRSLSLSGNHLTSISFRFSGLRHLSVINLADNNIRYIAPWSKAKARSSHRCVFIDLCCNPVQVRNPFGCKNGVATCREATCRKGIYNDENNATSHSRANHITGMNETLMVSLVTTAAVSVAIMLFVIAVIVSNDHRRTRFIGWLRRFPRIGRYRQLDTSVEM